MDATRSDFATSIAETAHGPVEYAVLGVGTPVVVVHGSPGGIDAAELMARILPRDGVAAILLSRPGYLGTPLADRATIDDQADLIAALLDHLEIARARVYTWSGGGPAGYRFAVRHPNRVTAVVANAACSQAYHQPDQDAATRLMVNTAPGRWLMKVLAARGAEQYVRGVIASEGDLTPDQAARQVREILDDPAKRQFVTDLGPTAVPDRRRRAGYRNDLDRFAEITTLELEKITTPTLVVHGSADADVPLEHGTFAARTIPGAELLRIETGTHLALYTDPDAATAQARVVGFLR